jgi:hypothetical protein
MNAQATQYIKELQRRGPAAWAQGIHGWIDTDGKPVVLHPWQGAVLNAWYEHRQDITTLGISNTKKTGKTFINAVLLAWRWLALPGQHFAAGNDLDQSQARQFQEIVDMVKRNPFLSENVKIKALELEFTLTGSRLTCLANDSAGNAGANHLTVSHTEAWGILYEASIRAWEELTPPPGLNWDLPALRVVDSYAGFTGESKTWHKLVDRGLTGDRISEDWPIYKIGGLMLFHAEGTEAQERCFRGTPAQRIDYYAEQAASMRPNAYSRMHCNQRTGGESAFVTSEQWDACFSLDVHPLQPGESTQLFYGADASQRHDYTALIGCAKGDYTDVRFVKVWKPKRTGKGLFKIIPIDLELTIGAELIALHKLGQVKACCYDPWQMVTVAKQWERAGITCIEMPQTNQRVEADTALYNGIVSGHVRHYKNNDLDEAVRNAIIQETPRGMRIAKEKATNKIDALVALSMAHHAAITQKVYGAMIQMPNFIYGEADANDYIFLGDSIIYAPKHTDKPHGPGVTWRNCKRRMDGCEDCIAELENEGVYAAQEKELELSLARGAGQPMSEAEYKIEMEYRRSVPLAEMTYQHDQQIKNKFWKAVKNNL